jgi:hypothetical protein
VNCEVKCSLSTSTINLRSIIVEVIDEYWSGIEGIDATHTDLKFQLNREY